MPELNESVYVVIAASAIAASEGRYVEAMAVIDAYDGPPWAVAFGLAVLAGQAIPPGSDMSSPLAIIERLLKRPVSPNLLALLAS
jgi:hypothetical protein